MRIIPLLASVLLLAACGKINPPTPKIFRAKPSELPLDTLQMPTGFKIHTYAEDVVNARSLEMSPNGTLFVGTRGEGKVYALRDTNADYHADVQYELARGLKMPNGVAFRDGDLYVAERSRILRFPDIEKRLDDPGEPEVVYDQYPTENHHGWKYIAFGPDGKLYVPVGAPCNICESDSIYASITRINPDGTGLEIVQHGVRNTVGFDWHPETGDLWFTDNGRDMMGDNIPECELNHAPRDGMHFGYPYCHAGDVPDPEFGDKYACSEFTAPVELVGPHVAPLGMKFYTGDMFPPEYRNQIFLAEHGSWNRSKKSGYKVTLVRLDGNRSVAEEDFIEGWLYEEEDDVWGRPVDVEQMADGSLLISDDYANAIYRLYYEQ